ncbi:MAG TPA: hypothetical protein VN808_05995 [Stellaceae bacterium]|nr:hypothetical protein [Stellaceae bacterium]
MESHDKKELAEARDALARELATLYHSGGDVGQFGTLPIIKKLRAQIAELTELLESEGATDATRP